MNKEEKKSGFCRACLLLCLCLLSASCASGEGEYEQEVPMEVALTRTDGVAGSESTPLLLFWKETDFSTGTLGSPYKISTPAGGIGDYADAPYNTEADYPADNSRVVVMGLCPSSMTMADNHGTYSLPSSGAGLTDVLVTPNGVTGSRKQPFGRALEFAHAAVRIVLKARRTDNTVGKPYVKNLKLTVPARLVGVRRVEMGYRDKTISGGSGCRRFGYQSFRTDIEYGGYAGRRVLSDTLQPG